MNVTRLLEKDHTTVKELFKQFEKAGDRAYQKKQAIFEQINHELKAHAQVEEDIFYPAVKQLRAEEVKDLVREAIEEHKIVKALLEEIAAMSAQEEQYDAKVTVLKESVEHHVKEEEGEMFPTATKHLSTERLEELGTEIAARKEVLAA
ncbi:MAG TPA: hemerythrin domain-containing protein [Candidatus Binatia bacterium]|jgi:hemerythrin superfamily protein|nr:hemerythrin domain-containing protein [Candidatus Binatia bacterium]